MANNSFFDKPKAKAPTRPVENVNVPEDSNLRPPDISLETLTDAKDFAKNYIDSNIDRLDGLLGKSAELKVKTKASLAMHLHDLDRTIIPKNTPHHILVAISELFDIDINQASIELTAEQLDCLTQLIQDKKNEDNVADAVKNSPENESPADFLDELIKRMTKKKYSWRIDEFLLKLLLLVMAYAVHMIIGGICRALMGKLAIPIPLLGSYPLGTILASSIVAPLEREAKRALGFPCDAKLKPPKICNIFIADEPVYNLLPCCSPGGLSAQLLKIQQKLSANSDGPLSTNIDEFLKSFDIKGSYSSGNITIGKKQIPIAYTSNDAKLELAESFGDDQTKQDIKQTKANYEKLKQNLIKAKEDFKNFEDKTEELKSFDIKGALEGEIQRSIDSIFDCWAQSLVALKHNEIDNPYTGPPCIKPPIAGNFSNLHIQQANQVMDYYIQKNALPADPKITNAHNIANLMAVWKKTSDLEDSFGEMKNFLKENRDLLDPQTRRCFEGTGNDNFFGPEMFSKAGDVINNPKAVFDRMGANNDMNLDFKSRSTTTATGDIGELLGNSGIPGMDTIGKTMQTITDSLEMVLNEMDKFVSSVNSTMQFFSSREFCCVIYLLVLVANVAQGKGLCPIDTTADFFKYANKINDKRDVQALKIWLSFLKAIIDTMRQALNVGLQINGIRIPLKDMMERVKVTVGNITKMLVDMITQPLEAALDKVLLNPDVQALVGNNCPYAIDILGMLKCMIEWFKLKIKQLVMEMFDNNYRNIDLIQNIRIGGLRFKVLDMLSKLIGSILNLLLNIGDCYDPSDYMKRIVSNSLADQYNDASRYYRLMDAARIRPADMTRWQKTIDGEDPLAIDTNLSKVKNDPHSDFTVALLNDTTLKLLRNRVPIDQFQEPSPDGTIKIVNKDKFVEILQSTTSVKLAQDFTSEDVKEYGVGEYVSMLNIFNMFKGQA